MFTRFINISPVLLSFVRAVIAIPVLVIFGLATKSLSFKDVTLKEVLPYVLSGVLMAFGWITLFMGFKNTDISIAVIVYNMCPVYVLLFAPIILKEKLRRIHVITVCIAFVGLFLIVFSSINLSQAKLSGVLFAALSGVLYAVIVIINRKAKTSLSATSITFIQMIFVIITLLPIILVQDLFLELYTLNTTAINLVLILGIVHTGLAYAMYFSTDIHGAITSVIAQAAAMGETSIFFADWTVRHPDNDNGELLQHFGLYPISLCKEWTCAKLSSPFALPGEKPGALLSEIKGGELTILRFDGDGGEYSLLTGKAKGIDGPYIWGTYLWIEVKDWLKLEKRLVEGPYVYQACKYIDGLKLDLYDEDEYEEIQNYLLGR